MPRPRLTLYVAGRRHGPVAELVRRIVTEELGGGVTLAVVDVLTDAAAAEADNILATPTLVFASGGVSRRIIGDLVNSDRLAAWLWANPIG